MYHRIFLIMILPILTFVFCANFEGGTYKSMQEDFDKIRIDNIEYTYKAIMEYKVKTGYFPFENESDTLPIVVVFETDQQAKYHKGNYPIFIDLASRTDSGETIVNTHDINFRKANEFYYELNGKLGKSLYTIHDPQKVPMKKPCLYIYTIYKKVFDLSCFLHNDFRFSRNISPFNNKLTFTSCSRSFPNVGLWNFNDIIKNSEYLELKSKKFNRGGYELLNK